MRPGMIARRWVVNVAAALAAVLGSLAAGPGYALPVELPGGPLHAWPPGWGIGTPVLGNNIVGFGLPNFTVWADHVVIDRVDLLDPSDVTLIGVRLAFLVGGGMRRHPGFYAVNTSFLTVCAGRTYPPPGGLGPSWEPYGIDLLYSDYPTLQVYLRANSPGGQAISGLRVHYHDGHGRRWYVDAPANLSMERVYQPSGGCEERRGGIWTGDRDYLPYVTSLD